MGTYFSGRKVVRAADATFSVSWSSVSTSDLSFTVTTPPTGCIGRIFIPLYKSTTTIGSTFSLWAEIPNGVGGFVTATAASYGSTVATLPDGLGTRNYLINSTTGVNPGPRVAAVDGIGGSTYNGSVIAWNGLYGTLLYPGDKLHFQAPSTAGANAGGSTLTCAVYELY